MSLFSRFFYKRPPDGLLEFVERVYVFDSCFSTEVLPEGMYWIYLREIVTSLYEEFPDSSFLAFNFREGEKRSHFAEVVSGYDVTVIDYPRQYEGCPLLPLSLMQHLLRVSEIWLSLDNQQNIILFHCERGGWPLLAFILASILVFRKLHTGEHRILEMVYREAPKGLLQLLSPLNPFPSQLRYLHYVARRNNSSEWPPLERSLSLDCLILRSIPSFDSNNGCRPLIRIFGRDFKNIDGLSTKMLFSMSEKRRYLRYYKQVDSDVIKIDIQCLVQGDTVLECVHQDLDSEREVMMFRIMFNTSFIRSNILILNCHDLDILWDSKDRFPRSFRAEVLFGDTENISPLRAPTAILNGEEKGGLPIEAFSRVQELFGGVEWLDNGDTAALWFLKQVSANALQEKIEKMILTDAKELTMIQSNISEQLSITSSVDTDEENYESDAVTTEASFDDAKLHDGVEFDIHGDDSQNAMHKYHLRKIDDLSGVSILFGEANLQNGEFLITHTQTSSPYSESAPYDDHEMHLQKSLMKPLPCPPPPPPPTFTSLCLDKVSTLDQLDPSLSSELDDPPLPSIPRDHCWSSCDSPEDALLHDAPSLPPSLTMPPSYIFVPPPPPPPPFPHLSRVISTSRISSTPSQLALVSPSLVSSSSLPSALEIGCLPLPHHISSNEVPTSLTCSPPSLFDKEHASLTSTLFLPPPISSSLCNVSSSETIQCKPPPLPPPPPSLPSYTCPLSLESSTTTSNSHPPLSLSPCMMVRNVTPSFVFVSSIAPTSSPHQSTSSQEQPYMPKVPPPPPPPPIGFNKHQQTIVSIVPPPPPPPPPPPIPTGSSKHQQTVTSIVPPPPSPPIDASKHQQYVVSAPLPPPPPPPMDSNKYQRATPPPPPPPPPLPPMGSIKQQMTIATSNPLPPLPPPPPPPPTGSNKQQMVIATSNLPPPPPPPPPMCSNKQQMTIATSNPPPPPLTPPPPMCFNKQQMTIATSNLPPPPPPPPPLTSSKKQQKTIAFITPPPPPPPPPMCSTENQQAMASIVPPPPPPPPPPIGSNSRAAIPAPPPISPSNRCPNPPPPPPVHASKSVGNAPPPPPLNPSNQGILQGSVQSTAHGTPVPPGPPPPTSKGKTTISSSGRGRGVLTTNSAPKKASLKPLHWVKVTKAMQGSLWAETQRQENLPRAPEIDISELESLFSTAVTLEGSKLDKGGSRRGSNANKPEIVHLVDMNRSKNCEIMLTKIKMPLQDLLCAILALDTSVLDIDQVENLIKFCPTKEEMVMLKNYTGNREMLGKCEQFFWELMKVPRVESKLRVFAFRITFMTQVNELRANLNTINDTSREVKDSVKLRQIMQTILTLGNALNQGTARGSAVGFRLDSLLKLSDTRARNNKMTLMHYLCKLLSEKMPELLDFDKDLVHLEAASKIQLKMVAEEMQAVSKGLEKVEQELTACDSDGPVSLGFREALKEFLYTAEAEVRSLISLYSEVGRNADSLAQYFGEDPARCPFEQVTSILVIFVNTFNKSREENARLAEVEKKKLEKEASSRERSRSFRKDGSTQ